jgi:antitoxin component YwqK of YwqJK toxin-antitoxin module/Tfp pilus assembly protein PilF
MKTMQNLSSKDVIHSNFSLKKSLFFVFVLFQFFNVSAQKNYAEIYDGSTFLETGIKLYDEGKYDNALAEFEKIFKTDPNYLKAQYEKIMCLSALEKKDERRLLLERLFNAKEMDEAPELLVQYGIYLSDNKEYDLAEKMLKDAEKFMPNSSMVQFNLGVLYLRKEERQKSIDYFKKNITGNPNQTSSHYFIGLLAYEDGKIVEGSLAMLGYLVNAPTGRYAKDAVLKLNTKMGQNFLNPSKYKFSETGDNFSELETILRNQLPLNPKYKIKSVIDDVYTRQVQAIVEYTATHKIEGGFFENIYIPWIADIANKNHTEAFSYYTLISLEDILGKKLTSQKKKILDFSDNYITKSFWNVYARRKIDHFGKQEEVIIYLSDGNPFMIGKVVDGKNQGKFKIVNLHGQIISELNYVDNELNGLQRYFYESGQVSEETYYSNGIKDGETKEFLKNGNLQSVGNYKSGKLNGPFITYHVNGGKQCELTFIDDIREGKVICYYTNGKKNNELNYTKGKLNGKLENYNEVGDLTTSYNYVNDELEGEGISYYDGKIIKSKANYKAGKVMGSYKEFSENQTLTKEILYENGKIKKENEYYENGTLSTETFYDDKELLEAYVYYDHNGQKYYEEKYKAGEIKMGFQYLPNNPKPIEVPLNSNPYKIKTLNGITLTEGYFEKGKLAKEWKYFYLNGNLRVKQNFSENKSNGLRTDYNRNGELTGTYNNLEGKMSGMYEGFQNGKLHRRMFYNGGDRNGPYQYFYENGLVNYEGYIVEDDKEFNQFNYYQDGKLMKIYTYISNILVTAKGYKKDGTLDYEFNYNNINGEHKFEDNNSLVVVSNNYTNGIRNGKGVILEKNGTMIAEVNYQNDELHGEYKSYNPNGKIALESFYYSGKTHGFEKLYDLAGNLRLTRTLIFDKEFGPIVRYYQNKQKIYEYESLDDVKEGEQKFYNIKGEIIAAIGYQLGFIKYYRVLDSNGILGKPIEVKDGTFEIDSNYPNGKKAFKLSLVKESFDGNMEIYGSDGLPNYISGFKLGMFHGERIEYYHNGKVYKHERLIDNNYEGVQEFFLEDGKPILVANYKYDDLHGDFKIYVNGVLQKTKKYDSDELVEISK